ncbi:hypothetical protein F3Y22_tig00110065pilonHSYRG00310 [Hibiscus syriacus]|uniref:RNA helicase n=1 Tax=Hibiscus syriacus TaxID=106335 RepID=A0A6A3BMH0_HIBSY|nr:hypothetical protein F3Y22_tig00110065pilonHSYRG00310 [Hibiscus syriacus]
MSLRLLGSGTSNIPTWLLFNRPLFAPKLISPFSPLQISSFAMSYRPNYQGGRRGGGPNSGRSSVRRGGGSGGGGRGGRGGEQRWWDPVWRAECLRQKAAEMEVLDEAEWWDKMNKMKKGQEQEMIFKRNFSRSDQQVLFDMAYELDLDERHGSTQKQIQMSTETERRVGNLLDISKNTRLGDDSGVASSREAIKPMPDAKRTDLVATSELILRRKNSVSNSVKVMRSFREKLPAFKVKAEFLKAVAENQVLVVSGETGCGKTTQLPQFILEEEISSLRGADCNIICTQPRHISAISVAARISSERGESLGETVGYQIRLESKLSAQTRLLFCTTGVLLRQLVQDPDLNDVSHLLVDEIHERGMNEDFLLIISRDLPRRPDLRLILMSTTINADLFSKYFGNAPTIHIPGLTFPVAELFLEDVLEKTRYNIKSEFDQGNSRRRRKELDLKKDNLTSLFEDVDIDSEYKSYSAATRHSLEAWSGSQIDLGLAEATIEHICRYEVDGAILVFLTGWDDISKILDKIKMNNFLGDLSKFFGSSTTWFYAFH